MKNIVTQFGEEFLSKGTNYVMRQMFTDGAWGSNQYQDEYFSKKDEVDRELADMGLAVYFGHHIGGYRIMDSILFAFRNLEDDFFLIGNEKKVWRPNG